ncbi:DUF4363 family protein [Alkalihalobacillus sp. BA299]|uniref:DUF4363 family protein n=1 Tax=Alkalihalobacillus sp. BA299 TaxID=2815938 RepID=UPI001ADCA1E7|nr:DUF4363 family protein [Alkalihalobacillus sp. BA299]
MSKHINFVVFLIMLGSLITGCSNLTIMEKDEILFNKIELLQDYVEKEDWEQALSVINDFQIDYRNRKWKMQFLGGLDDYRELELEIEKLKETIKENEKLESKVGLRQLKHRILFIYDL